MGAVSLMVRDQVGKSVASAATGKKPELNPILLPVVVLVKGKQGALNEDWVTVWFFTWKMNLMVSRGEALTRLGVKVRFPLGPPTMTSMVFPVEETGVGAGELG